jgi:ABC-type lipoprotein release transport system permease subunit
VRLLDGVGVLVVESAAGLLADETVAAARAASADTGMTDQPILTYLANQIRFGERRTPYSLVTALDLESFGLDGVDLETGATTSNLPPIVLNDWTADDLQAVPGDIVSVEYYLWAEVGALVSAEAEFQVTGVVPMEGVAVDRDFAPDYPGITEATDVSDWNPPFPIDLDLVRQKDEDYWDAYRTAAKGFLPLAAGQDLWRSRWGQVTSLRVTPPSGVSEPVAERYGAALRARLDPLAVGFVVYPARALALEAAVGVTDFGEYFTYFSFFLVVSALLLASLFFRLGVEQRLTEIGALRALGFDETRVHRLFWAEATVLSFVGGFLGAAGAVGYAELIMWGLRTWWVDAIGTTLLTLHVSPMALGVGMAGGMLAAVLSIAWTLLTVSTATPRALMSGSLPDAADGGFRDGSRAAGLVGRIPAVLGVAGGSMLVATLVGLVGDTVGFFGVGLLLLAALLTLAWVLLGQQNRRGAAIPSVWSVSRVGFRNATARPGRSVLCITLIACAAFIIVAVDAFHREDGEVTADRTSGTGGYPLLAESLIPIVLDLSSEVGLAELGVSALDDEVFTGATYDRFRVRPGEDASCLNLYQANNPRLLAPDEAFVKDGRFGFGRTMAESAAERANPWLLLDHEFADGAVPAIADATSLAYALHLSVGDDFLLNRDSDNPIRLRIVAALSDSIFQRELIIGERSFVRLFPEHEGYRFFLIDTEADAIAQVTVALEDRLVDYGFDVTSAAERLAAFHRVENTYLATFQALGALGLLLGTLGLGAVLLRNVLERRRELALLRAVGYNTGDITRLVLVENGLLLFGGLGAGTVCALVAIAPTWVERGAKFPVMSLAGLLLAVAVAGLVSSLAATIVVVRSPLLAALRSE